MGMVFFQVQRRCIPQKPVERGVFQHPADAIHQAVYIVPFIGKAGPANGFG